MLMSEQTFFKAYHMTKNELENTNSFKSDKKITVEWVNGQMNNSNDKLFDSTRYYDFQKILRKGKVDNQTFKSDNCTL